MTFVIRRRFSDPVTWRSRKVRFIYDRVVVSLKQAPDSNAGARRIYTDLLGCADPTARLVRARRIGAWAVLDVDYRAVSSLTDRAQRSLRLADHIGGDARVQFAEPDFQVRGAGCCCSTWTPNDAELGEEDSTYWAPTALEMSRVWNCQPGSERVLIAVLDSGVDLDHRDIDAARIPFRENYIESGDVAIDDPEGIVLPDGDGFEIDSDVSDVTGHGTSVTGFIAATANNGMDIAGMNLRSPLFIAKTLDDSDLGSLSEQYAATLRAIDIVSEHAELDRLVVNLSWVWAVTETTERTTDLMCMALHDAGAVLCCGAGHNSADAPVLYPARHSAKYPLTVIPVGVAALQDIAGPTVTSGGLPVGLYTYSPGDANVSEQIGVIAPGHNLTGLRVPSATRSNTTMVKTGTSYATPHVSALASLLWSEKPGALAGEIVTAIYDTAIKPESNADERWGHGLIQVCSAMGKIRDLFTLGVFGVFSADVFRMPLNEAIAKLLPRVWPLFRPKDHVMSTLTHDTLNYIIGCIPGRIDLPDRLDALGIEVPEPVPWCEVLGKLGGDNPPVGDTDGLRPAAIIVSAAEIPGEDTCDGALSKVLPENTQVFVLAPEDAVASLERAVCRAAPDLAVMAITIADTGTKPGAWDNTVGLDLAFASTMSRARGHERLLDERVSAPNGKVLERTMDVRATDVRLEVVCVSPEVDELALELITPQGESVVLEETSGGTSPHFAETVESDTMRVGRVPLGTASHAGTWTIRCAATDAPLAPLGILVCVEGRDDPCVS